MRNRSRPGFTIIELLIAIVVIVILAAITTVAYHGIQAQAIKRVAEYNLKIAAEAMQLEYQTTGEYPVTLPSNVGGSTSNNTNNNSGNNGGSGGGSGTTGTSIGSSNPNTNLSLKWSGTFTTYTNLTAVQNGVLLSQICQDLINEGAGKGVDKGGNTQSYITGCGNWNKGSMQVTAWNSKVWNTPVSDTQLLQYANSFTTTDTWNAAQIGVVKNFYTQLVSRQKSEGGGFPITSFWDSWATSRNGGTIYQALPATMQTKTSFCIEATDTNGNIVSHIGEDSVLRDGPC